ncbi:MAG: small basic protein [Planctomycetes bacterium]|nr:small basic protein [Planctomycetota bacterium]
MSIHRSLRRSSASAGHRNVLTKLERIEKLESKERWDAENDSLLGLPKVRSIKVAVKKKKKKAAEED